MPVPLSIDLRERVLSALESGLSKMAVHKTFVADKPTPQQKEASKQQNPAKQGFVVIHKRWIVERTNAWINQCRVLWKNCEGLLRTSEAKIRLCAIRLILRRLA